MSSTTGPDSNNMAIHKALILKSNDQSLSLETIPKPTAGPGEIVIKILTTHLLPYIGDIVSGKRPYPLVFPLVPGSGSVGRVDTIGPDTTSLAPGQLVFVEPTIRARDNPNEAILMGIHAGATDKSRKLMEGVWRDGTFAEYVKAPLENVYPLDEEKLTKLGYAINDLPLIQTCLVPFGGLSDAGVVAGDTVIVAPATGRFGGAAVLCAVAMGARVIAAGRNEQVLQHHVKVFGDKVQSVKLVGDVEKDTAALSAACGEKGADVYIDFCPPAAGQNGTPSHIKACINVLRPKGVASLMGGIAGDISIPYLTVMHKDLKIKGKWMYDRNQVLQMIKMIENGNMALGKKAGVEIVGEYGLGEIYEAMRLAAEKPTWGSAVSLVPRKA